MKFKKKFSLKMLDKKKTNYRLVIVMAGITGLFVVVLAQFYKLQILNQDTYAEGLRANVQREIELEAPRGKIFDRYGVPLAINKPINVLKIDPQIRMPKEELNKIILKGIELLEKNGDHYIDEIPLTEKRPFEFTASSGQVKIFINSLPFNGIEHRDELLTYTADELFDYLRSDDVFQVDESFTDEEARKIIAIRHQMYQFAYQKYKSIIIAEDISDKTLATLSERADEYKGLFVDKKAERYYPYGKEFGNVLGYTRKITKNQLESMADLGYDEHDVIGQIGVEGSMEADLKGQSGKDLIAVDNVGRKVFSIKTEDEIQGNDVYLTLDSQLQIKTYEAIEKRLAEAIVQRMNGGLRGVKLLDPREILISMVESNQVDFKAMEKAEKGTMQYELYQKLEKWKESSKDQMVEEVKVSDLSMKAFMVKILEEEKPIISNQELLLLLSEQGSLKLDESLIQQIKANKYPPLKDILSELLLSGDLKPDQMAIDPFSAAAAVIDVNTGEVLTVVGYPSYDSNEMTRNFNAYYSMLQDGIDKRNILWNRALMTAKAPGSTFKMISAIAGLEEGVISKDTQINDTGIYKRAGSPYPKCWIFSNNGYGHGSTDVHKALEVSCNYYFYDVAYRLGLKYGFPYGGINVFAKYMDMFGLSQKTNIEIPEITPNVSTPESLLRVHLTKNLNVIKNLSDKGYDTLCEQTEELFLKGIYPYANQTSKTAKNQAEVLLQKQIKTEMDDLLDYYLSRNLEELNDIFLSDLQTYLKNNGEDFIENTIDEILEVDDFTSLKELTIDVLTNRLKTIFSEEAKNKMLAYFDKIDLEEIRFVYEDAFEKLYKKQDLSQEVIQALKEKESLINDDIQLKKLLMDIVVHGMIDHLVQYLFEDVDLEWTNAVSIRTSIGQGNNAYSPLQIGRYVAGIANGEKVHDLKLINAIKDYQSNENLIYKPEKIYQELNLKPTTLEAVKEGMYRVTNGSQGTARMYFQDSEIKISGKTGTAQEGEHEHSSFVGFAPSENPQYVVVTTMYNADGLGKYNSMLARDIFDLLFERTESEHSATLSTYLN